MRAQSLTEYVILLVVVLSAIVGVQTFLRRGIQAQVKLVADDVLALSPADLSDPLPTKRGEATQALGMDTQDPGSGFDGGDVVSERVVKQTAEFIEERSVGGRTTRDATCPDCHFSRRQSSGRSGFSRRSEVPADFTLSGLLGQLGNIGELPIEVHLPKIPFDQPTPPTPEPPLRGPDRPQGSDRPNL